MSGVNVGTAYLEIIPSAKGFASKLAQDVDGPSKKSGRDSGTKFGGAFTVAAGALIATGVAKAAGFVSGYVSEAIAASDATDKFKQTLQFAGLKTSVIDTLTASTQKYADLTVYSLADIQSTTAQLAANSVPNYDKLAEAAGNLNAVAGGNAETFRSVGMVLTQTSGAGKLTTENWNQLANAIPGASGQLQAALLKNGAFTGNFRDAMAKGQITAEEFNKALLDLGMTDVAKKAATSTATIEGAWGNFEAVVVGGLSKIITTAKPAITGFLGLLSGAVEPAFASVATGVQRMIDTITGTFKLLKSGDFTADIGKMLGVEEDSAVVGVILGIRDAIVSAKGALTPLIVGLQTGNAALLEMSGKAGGWLADIVRFGDLVGGALGKVPELAGQMVAGIGPMLGQLAGPAQAMGATLLPIIQQLGPGLLAAIQPLLPVIGQLVSGFAQAGPQLSPLMVVLKAAQPIIPQLVQALTSLGTALASILSSALASVLPVLVQLGGLVTSELVPALSTLIGAILPPLSVLFGVIAQVVGQVLSAVMPLVSTLLGILIPVIGELVTMLAPLIAQLATALVPAFQLVGQIVTVLVGILTAVLIPVIQALMPIVTTVFGVIVQVISAALNIVTGVINVVMSLLKGDWAGAWNGILQILSGVWDLIKAVVLGAINIVVSVIVGAWSALVGIVTNLWAAIKDTVVGALQAVWGFVSGIVTTIGKAISDAWSSLVKTTTTAWNDFKGAVVKGAQAALDFVTGLPGKIIDALSGLGQKLVESGKSLIKGFADGIRDGIGGAVSAATDALGAIRDLFPFSPAKEGPFSGKGWTLYSGRAISSSLAEGMLDGASDVHSAALSVTEAAQLGAVRTDAGMPSASGLGTSMEASATLLAAAVRSALDGATLRLDDEGNAIVRVRDVDRAIRLQRQGVGS